MFPFLKRYGQSLVSTYDFTKPDGKIRAINLTYKIVIASIILGTYNILQKKNKILTAEQECRQLLEERKVRED